MLSTRAAIGAALLVAAVPASAAASECADASPRATAALTNAAQRDFAAGKFAEAATAYANAYACTHEAALLFNLAKAQHQDRRYAEALLSMRAFLRDVRDPAPEVRAAAEEVLADASARVALLDVRSDPPGAQVFVQGAPVGTTPLEAHPVNPGIVTVRIVSSGEEILRQDLRLREGQRRVIESRSAEPAPPPTFEQPVVEPGGTGTPIWVWTALGIGGAGIAIGTISGLVSLAQTSDIQDQCDGTTCPQNTTAARSEANTWANVSNVGFVVGALGAGVGIVGLVVTSGDEAPSTVSLSPSAPQARLSGAF